MRQVVEASACLKRFGGHISHATAFLPEGLLALVKAKEKVLEGLVKKAVMRADTWGMRDEKGK